MKIALPLALLAFLTMPVLPVAAQDAPASLGFGDWTALQRLKPGTEVVVTSDGSPAADRYLVLSDASRLTLLNLTDPALPREATRTLMDIGSRHPEFFASAPKGGQFVDRDVRVGPDGVFVAGRKVADLQQIVETIPQARVVEVASRQRGRGFWGHLGPLGGYFVGAMAGGYIAGLACKGVRDSSCDGAFLSGGFVGGIAGAIQGSVAARRETEVVVYRGR
jgi:hypothetical protein